MSEALNGLVATVKPAQLSMMTAEQALKNWEQISRLLQPAVDRSMGRVSLEGIRKAVEDELGIIVIGWDPSSGETYVAFFCEVEQYDTGRRCWKISQAGGHEIDEWIHLWPVLKGMGRQFGCDHVELVGRPGWFRKLGLREVSRVYVGDLTDGN